MTSDTRSPRVVYTDSWNVPLSISYLAEIGTPSVRLSVIPLSSGSHAPRSCRASASRSGTDSDVANIGTPSPTITLPTAKSQIIIRRIAQPPLPRPHHEWAGMSVLPLIITRDGGEATEEFLTFLSGAVP